MILNVSIPANTLIVYEVFYELATFDLIPLDWLIELLDNHIEHLDNNKDVELSPKAIEESYGRSNPIVNLILPLFILCVTFLCVGLIKLISLLKSKMLKRLYSTTKKMVFWNHLIRFFTEEYIMITIACMIKLYAWDLSNTFEDISSIFAVLLLAMTIAFPIIATYFMWKQHSEDGEVMQSQAW